MVAAHRQGDSGRGAAMPFLNRSTGTTIPWGGAVAKNPAWVGPRGAESHREALKSSRSVK
eukprot:6865101-Pyramimonas_sp.AAC.1